MICIQHYRHDALFRLLAFTDEPSEADDFREDFVTSKTAGDLPIPRFRLLTEDRSAQLRQFLLYTRQPGFQFFTW